MTDDYDAWECAECSGNGWRWQHAQVGERPSDTQEFKSDCPVCAGLGWLGPDADKAYTAQLVERELNAMRASPKQRDTMHSGMRFIETAIAENNVDVVVATFNLMDWESFPIVVHMGLLRCAFRIRASIPSWDAANALLHKRAEAEGKPELSIRLPSPITENQS